MTASRLLFLSILVPLILIAFAALADGPWPVQKITDGDTIVVLIDGKAVKTRLLGLDTPETKHPKKPVERFGREASAFTKSLLEGESVRLDYDWQRRDRYGRLLAYVYRDRDGLLVNKEIIRAGFGHALVKHPHRKMEEFRAAEREAREAGRGLWGER